MKYLITPYLGHKGDGSDVNEHARYCKANQVPNLYALTSRKRCLLICECAHIEGTRMESLEAHVAEIQAFFQALGERYPKPARINPGFPAWYFFNRLPNSEAAQVAEETYDFLIQILNKAVGE